MSALNHAADWLFSLPAWALACVTFMIGSTLGSFAMAFYYFWLAAKSGAGETNEGEVEEGEK